jgi:CheY-like chemotaxis protein
MELYRCSCVGLTSQQPFKSLLELISESAKAIQMNTSTHSEQKPRELNAYKSAHLHKTRHDVRGAMHVVTGMSQVLAMSDTLPPAQKKAVAMLKKNADLAMKLIDDMFDFLEEDLGAAPDKKDSDDQETLSSSHNPLKPSAKKLCALLVEDSEPNVLIAGSFLKELGYNYDVAKNGSEALNKFSTGHYDIIIMDVQMPGMDGLEATRQIRAIEKKKNLKPTPILATTGNATEDDQLFCTKAGMNDCIAKPFELADLGRKLREIVSH